MGAALAIKYLHRDEIDTRKWDACIDQSTGGKIYGYSWYLDHFATHWDGLVLNDYEAVMPLPARKKWGIAYLYPPFLCAQLGVFGKKTDPSLVKAFLLAIPKKFRYIDIYLNESNTGHTGIIPGLYERDNFVLELVANYPVISKAYRDNTKRNLRKAASGNFQTTTGLPISEIISLARNEERTAANGSDADFQALVKLYDLLFVQNKAETWAVKDESGKTLSSCLFLFSHNRAYYILVGNTRSGIESGASYFLIDSFIKKYAGTGLLLDFEGSDIPGLAFFYSGFGAEKVTYLCYKKIRWA